MLREQDHDIRSLAPYEIFHPQENVPTGLLHLQPGLLAGLPLCFLRIQMLYLCICICVFVSEMSSDSRESLNHRDPFPICESQYRSRYQDCDPKSLYSSLNIKTQDLRVLFPALIKTHVSKVSISILISGPKCQKSQFQS